MNKQNWSETFPCHMLFAVLLVWGLLLAGCAQMQQQAESMPGGKQDGLPVDITGFSLKQGLEAVYFYAKLRHIDEMPVSEGGIAKYGHPGPPIYKLDNEFGRKEVFDSGRNAEVAVLMRGYLHLDRPGEYLFRANSNDGVQMYIDGNLIFSDPVVHGDRLTDTGTFRVVQGGIFPVEIRYFQRKGTATLQLFWQPPGTSFFTIVPSLVYSHMAK